MTARDLDHLIADGLARHRAGEAGAALSCYRRALAVDPGHADALHLASVAALETGDAAAALEHAEAFRQHHPDHPEAAKDRGNALQAAGDAAAAARAFEEARRLAPSDAVAAYNLANARHALGDAEAAVAAYRDALDLAPDLAAAWSNLSAVLATLGLSRDAVTAGRRAVAAAPEMPAAHYNLGNAHRETGDLDAAVAAYEQALTLAPEMADAHCNLGLALIEDDPDRAARHLAAAQHLAPGHKLAAFYRGVAWAAAGDATAAVRAFAALEADDPVDAARLASWRYVEKHAGPETVLHADGFRLRAAALAAARPDGLVLEFGVRHGTSLRQLASLASGPVHGFDSFEGLPTAWGHEPAGVYSTGGRLPDVPANVELHVGLFEDTLAPFLDAHPGPLRLVHVDCDLYASTRTVLDVLAPRLGAGSVVVFDEYLINPTWREDEHRAWRETCEAQGFAYDYVGFSLVGKQAAVRLL